jgi:protein-S-isoprenylcysteine O-methyltransferase Ste14
METAQENMAIAFLALIMPALIWKLLYEETFLREELQGDTEYKNKVARRLVPFV